MKSTFFLPSLGFRVSLLFRQHSSCLGFGLAMCYTHTYISLSPVILTVVWAAVCRPPAFLTLLFFPELLLRDQKPNVQLVVLLPSEILSAVKIVSPFLKFLAEVFWSFKVPGGHPQLGELNLSSQVGGMRRRGKDIRNSLGKQVIRTVSPN